MPRIWPGVDSGGGNRPAALARLPVLRKAGLTGAQAHERRPSAASPRAGSPRFDHVFQSPGPIYEPGGPDATGGGWAGSCMPAGSARRHRAELLFLSPDPAGMMFESAAAAVGAAVLPAGTGQTELQAQAAPPTSARPPMPARPTI
jgi:phenylacetate-CoA ligase